MATKISLDAHKQILTMTGQGQSTAEICQALGLGATAVNKYARISLPEEGLSAVDEHRLKRENISLNKVYKNLLRERAVDADVEKFLSNLLHNRFETPEWARGKGSTSHKEGIPTLFYSDAHAGEVVKAEEVDWLNGYDPDIFRQRTKNFFFNGVRILKDYWNLNYPGIYLDLGGDLISGSIHEELAESNAMYTTETVILVVESLVPGIKFLAEEFGQVTVVSTYGNHPRLTRKPRAKGRARDNMDWLISKLLEREIKADPRYANKVTFMTPDAPDTRYDVYGFKYLLTHGDQAKGGSGIAGALSPLMILDARKRRNRPYDYLVAGHWHTLIDVFNVFINGALKGYDEYAFCNNFKADAAKQLIWITDPRHGVTFKSWIQVESDDEPWKLQASSR